MSNPALKLLVVDDDDVDRERIRRMLKSASVEAVIEEAIDADESLAILNDCDYDCIIVDYKLGTTDGLSLLNSIRTTLSKRCAVIMVTGLGDEEVAAEAMRLGASDYLVKNQLKSPQLLRAILSAVHRAELETKLHDMAHYDSLTGLASRHLLLDRLQQVISTIPRSDKISAIAFIDLDNFKPVNDHHGHEAGDFVLVELADRLSKALRRNDTVARIGGDEFVLLLTNIDNSSEYELLLHRIRLIINVPFNLPNGYCARISASIGVTLVDDTSVDADTVLRRADQTMYQAKNSGKNQIYYFNPEEERKIRKRRDMLDTAERSLKNNNFFLFYQPKIDLRNGSVHGLEALIRWQHPELGLLSPDRFSEVLTHTSLGITMGEWVLNEALKQLSFWAKYDLNVKISVNVSVPHLQNYGFTKQLHSLIERYDDVSPSQLEIEVLETSSIQDMERVVAILNECRQLGVKVALDDFGTGYASLSYLKKLPLDTLKIDRSFVINMLKDADDLAIVESIVGLSQVFGYELIAEGVETKAHEKALLNIGCPIGQGYSLARPMGAEEIISWMSETNSKLASP